MRFLPHTLLALIFALCTTGSGVGQVTPAPIAADPAATTDAGAADANTAPPVEAADDALAAADTTTSLTAAKPEVQFSQQAVAAMAEETPLDLVSNPRREFHLRMHHLHTGESLDVTYRVGNRYVPSALAMLDKFLRDHRTGAVASYDPHEFDALHAVMTRLRRPNGIIDIVCGYRSEWSNEYLRDHTRGVAEHSQHMEAKAIDIRVPGVSTRRLDRAALSVEAGGVGYYPRSRFVHVDVGPVRQWTLR